MTIWYDLMKKYDLDEGVWSDVSYQYSFQMYGNLNDFIKSYGVVDTESYLEAYIELITTC